MGVIEPWFIRLLGKLELQQGSRPPKILRNGSDAHLLGYLAFHRDQEHARERLAELLWPENPDGLTRLRSSLARLRGHLEPKGVPDGSVLITGRTRVTLNPEVVDTDVAQLQRLGQEARLAPPQRRYELLSEAVTLYRGELLPLRWEDWVLRAREQLAHQHYEILRTLPQLAEQQGERQKAIHYALTAIAANSEDLAPYLLLMQLYGAEGRFQEALHLYRRLLRRHSTVAIPEEIRALASQLRRSPESLRKPVAALHQPIESGSPHPREHPAPKHSLPRPVTRFFGRDAEKAKLRELLKGENPRRMVTILGMGGLGKTRLALEVAEHFPGTLYYAELAAPCESVEALSSALLAAVDPKTEHKQDSLKERLYSALFATGAERVLLILDNGELTTTEAARRLLSQLLMDLPQLSLLVASRRALLPELEQQFPLLPLPLPSTPGDFEEVLDSPSIQLFMDRAQARKLDFRLTKGNASTIASLVAGLEGIPLAIELAAARAGVLTPTQMQALLPKRETFLVDSRQERPARHRSLSAALEGTYALLEPGEQRFFAGLALFQGGFSAEAADAVTATGNIEQTLARIEKLREVALVVASSRSVDLDVMRFTLLESVRAFALEKLEHTDQKQIHQYRHRDYMQELVEQARVPLLNEMEQSHLWKLRLQAELDNIRVALRFCQEDPEGALPGLTISGVMRYYFEATGLFAEGRQLLATALSHPAAPRQEAEYQKALNHACILASYLGDWREAQQLCRKTLRLRRASQSRYREAVSLHNLGQIAQRMGKLRSARVLYERSLSIELELAMQLEGKDWLRAQQGIADSHHNLGRLALIDRRYEDAKRHFDQCLPEYQQTKNRLREALTLSNMGLYEIYAGELPEAERIFHRVLELGAEIQDKRVLATALSGLGQVHRRLGNLNSSATFLKASLENEVALGNQTGIAESLGEIAELLITIGTTEALDRATRLFGAEESLRASIHSPRYAPDLAERETRLAVLMSVLGEAGFRVAWSTGRAMTKEESLSFAQAAVEKI